MSPSTSQAASAEPGPGADPSHHADSWAAVPALIRDPAAALPSAWDALFAPLRGPRLVIGQIGQSLDGRIATPTGHSHYINGPAGLTHLHRLRALVDAVVVGIGTVLADDPQLTVRRAAGPQPARVVIDRRGRLPAAARLLANDGARRLAITAQGTQLDLPGTEIVALPHDGGQIAPHAILAALAERGLSRVLIEGGADTVSRFLTAGALDRLHVVVAPMILGSGPTGINLPPITRCDEALRAPMQMHQLGDEMLFDCDLSAQREDGRANRST